MYRASRSHGHITRTLCHSVFKSPSDLYPGRQCVGAKRALLTLGRGTCITASPRGARTPMGNAIPPGLTIITDVVHVLLRGTGGLGIILAFLWPGMSGRCGLAFTSREAVRA